MSDLYLSDPVGGVTQRIAYDGPGTPVRSATTREGAHRRMEANDKFRRPSGPGRHRAKPVPEVVPAAVVSAPEETRVISAQEQAELLARARQGAPVPGEHLAEITFDVDGQVTSERLVRRAKGAAMAADQEIGSERARRSIAQLWQSTLATCLKALGAR